MRFICGLSGFLCERGQLVKTGENAVIGDNIVPIERGGSLPQSETSRLLEEKLAKQKPELKGSVTPIKGSQPEDIPPADMLSGVAKNEDVEISDMRMAAGAEYDLNMGRTSQSSPLMQDGASRPTNQGPIPAPQQNGTSVSISTSFEPPTTGFDDLSEKIRAIDSRLDELIAEYPSQRKKIEQFRQWAKKNPNEISDGLMAALEGRIERLDYHEENFFKDIIDHTSLSDEELFALQLKIKEATGMDINFEILEPLKKHHNEYPDLYKAISLNYNNQVGLLFQEYVRKTQLRGLDERNLLFVEDEIGSLDLGHYLRPDFQIAERGRIGHISAIADAKFGAIEWTEQTLSYVIEASFTKSRTLIFYTPDGRTSIPSHLFSFAEAYGVTIRQIAVPWEPPFVRTR